MGQDSKIEWTEHTFNPWWGCEKVSPACAHCYAETFSRRVGFNDDPHDGEPGSQSGPKPRLWGPGSERRMFGDKHWAEPLKWNRDAARDGVRRRVFCASMADVFEDREGLRAARSRLYMLVMQTRGLDWLLLTKRPENAQRLWLQARKDAWLDHNVIDDLWPSHIWLGTTVEDQRRADDRIPHLLGVKARVRFLSVEPLLERVDLRSWLFKSWMSLRDGTFTDEPVTGDRRLDWVIVGGESGPGARPMHPRWARDVRDQCVAAGVPFLFKQWGEHLPIGQEPRDARLPPDPNVDGGPTWRRLGKKLAGRELDGRTWDESPR